MRNFCSREEIEGCFADGQSKQRVLAALFENKLRRNEQLTGSSFQIVVSVLAGYGSICGQNIFILNIEVQDVLDERVGHG